MWFVPAFGIFFILMWQSLYSSIYKGHERELMEWYGTLVWPISTLIVGALVANAGIRADRRVIDKALMRIAQFCCAAYILALFLTILAPGIGFAREIGKEPWAMLAEARPWRLGLQGVVSAMLGVFFSQSFLVEKVEG
jgi:hypothetical protein